MSAGTESYQTSILTASKIRIQYRKLALDQPKPTKLRFFLTTPFLLRDFPSIPNTKTNIYYGGKLAYLRNKYWMRLNLRWWHWGSSVSLSPVFEPVTDLCQGQTSLFRQSSFLLWSWVSEQNTSLSISNMELCLLVQWYKLENVASQNQDYVQVLVTDNN